MTAGTQEAKKKSTGNFQSLLEESPLASTFKDYYETPRENVPDIFGNVGLSVKSPLSGYGSTPFKGDEKYSYPFTHGEKKEPKKEETSFLEAPLPFLIDKAKSFAADNTIGDLEDGKFQGPKPSDFVTDDSPNELQRLINRAVARGIRANIFASQQKGARIEDLAYLNTIEQRDAPRYEDYLVADPATLAGSPSFVLDALRSVAESLISQVAAAPIGLLAAGAGAATGTGVGLLGGPFAEVTVPAAATYGALGAFSTATSAAIEYGGKVNEVLMEAGVDVTDADELTKAFADEKLMDKAREMGLRRGIPVGAFDGVAAMVGGQLVGKAFSQGSRAVRKAVVKEAGIQAALGAGGETAGQVIAGEEIRPRDIALEAFAEVLSPSVGTVYNIAKENALGQAERNYLDFAEKQDQKKLAEIRNLTFAVNNAEIAAVDDQITDLRRSRISEERPERKAIDAKIKQLVNQKYTRMREIQEDLIGTLSDEEIAAANSLVDEIITAQASLRKSTDLSPAERSAVEDQFKTSAQALQDIYAKASEARAQKPAAPEAGTEPGQEATTTAQISEATTSGRISQSSAKEVLLSSAFPDLTPEQRQAIEASEDPLSLLDEEQKATLDAITEKRIAEFKKKNFLNLYAPLDRIAYAREMESQTPSFRREMEKVMLAFDAFRQVAPDGKFFNVGFGKRGYTNAGLNAGFSKKDLQGSLGITSSMGRTPGTRGVSDKVALQFSTGKEDITGVGYKGTSNPFKTASHEIFHNVFASHFEKNETDFNQFRDLVIRRLSESDVRRLNEFADRYKERDVPGYGGAYKSEEFMVDLGALLSDEQVTFQKNFLEEVKAFLNNVVGKLTGQTVQIFEDAALSRDIASYMTGVSQAIRTGGKLSDVKMSERLKSDRFKRTGGPSFNVDDVLDDKPFVNAAGREDPASYERQLRSDEVLFEVVSKFTDRVLSGIEKKLNIGALRGVPKALLQAMEAAGSMNIESNNRFSLTMMRLRKTINNASVEERARITELSKEVLFSEDTDARAAAFGELMNGTPIEQAVASDISVLIAIREKQQNTLINSTAFDNLSEGLRETIKSRSQFYGTRTYRLFTDPNFKPDNALKETAISDLVQLEIDERAEALFFENAEIKDADGNVIEDPDEVDYMSYVQRKDGLRIANSVRAKVNNIVDIQGQKKSGGDSALGELRVPSKKLGKRGDLPESLRNFMGEEKNPFVRMSQTFTNLNSIIQQYTLVDQVNQAARNSGLNALIVSQPIVAALKKGKLRPANLLSLARQMNIIPVDEGYKGNSDVLRNLILDKLQLEYTQVNESKSPMNGKYVSNDFLQLFKQTPLYSSENPVMQAYFAVLLQLRRIRVLYNLPTWRKNIMGGYYFLMLNGVLPYNKARGGFTFLKDTRNRFRKLKTGQYDPETQATFEELGENGLLGGSVNLGLLSDINNSFINSLNGENPSDSWSWLAKLNNTRKEKAARLGYQYGAIDDYTKFVAYTAKRENFAKRLASNPEGKPYAQLSPEEQKEVQKMTAERIKQNFPTMSRIHPAFRQLMRTPLGDFLSFRLEAFRSYFSVVNNAVSDINEAISNSNLSTSQRNAYLSEGITALTTAITLASIQNIGYIAAAQSFYDDDEERELASQMRGVPFLLPNWMQGSNVIPASMKADGTIRYINVSSEDPYDEVGGLIFGRNGVSRSETLTSIAKDFTQPNMLVGLAINLQKGQDSYGKDISDPNDNAFAKAINISGYLGSEIGIPPNIKFIIKKIKEEAKASEDPDYELKPLETAFQLSTNTVFRDYPVKIGSQFYYNLRDGNFGGKQIYAELSNSQKIVLRSRLERVREGYTTLTQYGEVFGNPELQDGAKKNIMRTFRDDEDALYYLLAGVGPIAEDLDEDSQKSE